MHPPKQKPLVIRDELHGDITFDSLLRQVIDHEHFQRLRYIKQLGLAEYVFPCANHTRFQHSLGASYLAGRYFHHMLKAWMASPLRGDVTVEGTKLFPERTLDCVRAVADHAPSREFWWQTVSLAGMLHDVGHGPWSHSFEYLNLRQDFSSVAAKLPSSLRGHFEKLDRYWHEDISVLYVFRILEEVQALSYFLPVASLINKRLSGADVEAEIAKELKERGIRGGTDFHRLLRPIISGPFDVDRMDYIQRDGRNCGVSMGGIEWRRIVSKVVPCLADHRSENGQPREVCLISNLKNQHVLDDFSFSLFQMYAQVYLHPKIVGLEEAIKDALTARLKTGKGPTVTFDLHRSLSDEKFRDLLKRDFNAPEIDDILLRKPRTSFRVASFPEDPGINGELKANQFRLVELQDRPMMKDGMGIFLFGSVKKGEAYFLRPWEAVSPIARHFGSIRYSPNIWIRKEI